MKAKNDTSLFWLHCHSEFPFKSHLASKHAHLCEVRENFGGKVFFPELTQVRLRHRLSHTPPFTVVQGLKPRRETYR